jgi:hypothetical protein
MPFPQALERVRKSPGMYISPVEFDVMAAFLQGFHVATNGGLLQGFREWLVIKLDHGNNLAWSQLVLHLAFPETPSPEHCLVQNGGQQRAIDVLFRLVEEFWQAKESPRGLRGVYVEYQHWLERQDWYGPSSPLYIADAGKPAGQPGVPRVPKQRKRA